MDVQMTGDVDDFVDKDIKLLDLNYHAGEHTAKNYGNLKVVVTKIEKKHENNDNDNTYKW